MRQAAKGGEVGWQEGKGSKLLDAWERCKWVGAWERPAVGFAEASLARGKKTKDQLLYEAKSEFPSVNDGLGSYVHIPKSIWAGELSTDLRRRSCLNL